MSASPANNLPAPAALSGPDRETEWLAKTYQPGATNLTVSFSLSLGLALHARHARLRDMPTLTRDLLRSGLVELPSWILPVGASAAPHATEEHSG